MQTYAHEIRRFQKLNELSAGGGAVFLGGTFFARIPVSELAGDMELEKPVFGRSLPNLTLEQAQQLVPGLLKGLRPDAIFLNLGDSDLEEAPFDPDAFCEKYEWLLYTVHRLTSAKLHIVSIVSDSHAAAAANRSLAKLAKSIGCAFIDISDVALSADPEVRAFQRLRPHVRGRRLGFAEAMTGVSA